LKITEIANEVCQISYFQNRNLCDVLKTTKVVDDIDETFGFQNGNWCYVLKINLLNLK